MRLSAVTAPGRGIGRALGFVEAPLPADTGHARANIRMVLDLTPSA
jgi:hypothetical protein